MGAAGRAEVGMASLAGQFGSGNFTRLSIAEIVPVTAGWCYFNLHNNRAYGHVDDRRGEWRSVALDSTSYLSDVD